MVNLHEILELLFVDQNKHTYERSSNNIVFCFANGHLIQDHAKSFLYINRSF